MVEVFHVVRRVWDASLRFRVGVQRWGSVHAYQLNSKQIGILKVTQSIQS